MNFFFNLSCDCDLLDGDNHARKQKKAALLCPSNYDLREPPHVHPAGGAVCEKPNAMLALADAARRHSLGDRNQTRKAHMSGRGVEASG